MRQRFPGWKVDNLQIAHQFGKLLSKLVSLPTRWDKRNYRLFGIGQNIGQNKRMSGCGSKEFGLAELPGSVERARRLGREN